MKWLGQIAITLAAVALIMVVARGITPVFPALGGVLRGLLHPVVLLGLVGILLLLRLGPSRRSRD